MHISKFNEEKHQKQTIFTLYFLFFLFLLLLSTMQAQVYVNKVKRTMGSSMSYVCTSFSCFFQHISVACFFFCIYYIYVVLIVIVSNFLVCYCCHFSLAHFSCCNFLIRDNSLFFVAIFYVRFLHFCYCYRLFHLFYFFFYSKYIFTVKTIGYKI